MSFSTPITLTGPFRAPAQMLDEQVYDGHVSVHDGETAANLGLRGAPIEGPTHFSQFDPLAFALWGPAWFEHGCISAHFQQMVVAGDEVQASVHVDAPDARLARIGAVMSTGPQVLTGTVSVGPEHPPTELDARLAAAIAKDPGELFVIDQVALGPVGPDATVSVDHHTANGDLYPFSLAQKLAHITERHDWYTPEGGASSPWGRAVLPVEMISVLAAKAAARVPVRHPSIGLFLDLEIRLLAGPVFVGETYTVRRSVLARSQSRRTESFWLETIVTAADGTDVARVLLHSGVFKESYPGYPADRLA